jgi:hypothetical protein
LKWSGLGSLAMVAGIPFRKLFFAKKKYALADHDKNETVKMLTQDGHLVEVATRDLGCNYRKMISDEELKRWVNPK